MHRAFGAVFALARLADCANQTTSAALAAAEWLVADIAALEQELRLSGATVTRAKMEALTRAVGIAQAAVSELARGRTQISSALTRTTAALQEVAPFQPEIAAAMGAHVASQPLAASARVDRALAQLQADLAALRAAS